MTFAITLMFEFVSVIFRSRNAYLDTCFNFFDHIFQFAFRICFYFMIIYVIVLHQIRIHRFKVSPSLNWGPVPSCLI